MDAFEAELRAIALRQSPTFRDLRKLALRAIYDRPLPARARIGLLVDCETTGGRQGMPGGTNGQGDEVIELGMLRFAFTSSGTILGPLAEFQAFREPSKPIPVQVMRLTGITDAMVAEAAIDPTAVRAFVEPAEIVIAHGAGFSRRFCERAWDVFTYKAWGCSLTQVPWRADGVESSKLFYIGASLPPPHAFWFEGHRALDDCRALLEILELPLPVSGETPLAMLLAAAGRPSAMVWALGAPFAVKDRLRERGYRWNVGDDGRPRAWHRDVELDQVRAELRFLDELGFPDVLEPLVVEIDATLRFSDRMF